MNTDVRVRFAPSPTGLLHLGGVRTALYNFLYAKQNNGAFYLRIEDTDRSRYVEGSVENLIDSLVELGITPFENINATKDLSENTQKNFTDTSVEAKPVVPIFQSDRLELYHRHVAMLIEKGLAYRCFCTKEELEFMRQEQAKNGETTKYDGRCREYVQKCSLDELTFPEKQSNMRNAQNSASVVRIKIPPNRIFEFHDLLRGTIQISSDQIEDQVILKADGFPTYHLASVIDDHYMRISHVLRGEEWLYSTPKHMFLYEAFGWEAPVWVHLPLLLNTDKSKLSKRHGDFSVANYLKMGYLKEAIINFVALLGWHATNDRELYTIEELIKEFSLERLTKSGAVFDITKLDWMNGIYIRSLPLEYISELCRPFFVKENIDISDEIKYQKVINRARSHIVKLPEILEHSMMFYKDVEISKENREILESDDSKRVLKWFIAELEKDDSVVKEISDISVLLKRASSELGLKGKQLFFPLRIALFGDCHGPDIPTLIDIYGVGKTIEIFRKILCS